MIVSQFIYVKTGKKKIWLSCRESFISIKYSQVTMHEKRKVRKFSKDRFYEKKQIRNWEML